MPAPKGFFKTIFLAGLIAGALDLTGAIVTYLLSTGRFPTKILEYIAGGAFGNDAMTGGDTMKLWGFFFHFFIAMAFAYFYFLIYPKIKLLQKNIMLSAVLYGLFVWAVMNLAILPLSAYHSPFIPSDANDAAKQALILVICVGLPIAIGAQLYFRKEG